MCCCWDSSLLWSPITIAPTPPLAPLNLSRRRSPFPFHASMARLRRILAGSVRTKELVSRPYWRRVWAGCEARNLGFFLNLSLSWRADSSAMAGLEKPEQVSEGPSARAFARRGAAHPAARAESSSHAAGPSVSVSPAHAALAPSAAVGATHASPAPHAPSAPCAYRAAHASSQNESVALSDCLGRRDFERQGRRREQRGENQNRDRIPHDVPLQPVRRMGIPSTTHNITDLPPGGCEPRHRISST